MEKIRPLRPRKFPHDDAEISLVEIKNLTGGGHNLTEIIEFGEPKSFMRGMTVLLLRIGFTMIQVGSIPTMCVYTMVFHNLLDMLLVTICFCFIGFIVATGKDDGTGIIGTETFIANESADLDAGLRCLCSCIIGSAIITTFIADRVHITCFVMLVILNCTFFHPWIMHWIWSEEGWLAQNQLFSEYVSFKDLGGSLIVHYYSGMIGLIGAIALGGRLIKLSTIHDCSITRSSVILVPLGYFLIILGLMGIPLPTPLYQEYHKPSNQIARILMNQLAAVAGGMLTVLLLLLVCRTRTFDYWKVSRIMQGGVAGIVCIAAGVDVYSPLSSFVIALILTAFVYLVLVYLFRTPVEDYCNVFAVHVVSGFFGTLVVALFGERQNLGFFSVSVRVAFIHFVWQLVGLLTVTALVVIFFSLFFFLSSKCNCLRNRSEVENHARSQNVERPKKRKTYCQSLRDPSENVPYFEPGFSGRVVPVPGKDGAVIGGFMGYKGSNVRITTLKKKKNYRDQKGRAVRKEDSKEKRSKEKNLSFA